MITLNQPTSLDEALNAYRQVFLPARNLAQRTRVEYVRDLADLVSFLKESCGLATVQDVGRVHLEAFLAELDRLQLKGSSRRRKVASIRSLFAFLVDQGVIAASPAQRLIPPAREYHQPRFLTEPEYKRLREAAQYNIRDLALSSWYCRPASACLRSPACGFQTSPCQPNSHGIREMLVLCASWARDDANDSSR